MKNKTVKMKAKKPYTPKTDEQRRKERLIKEVKNIKKFAYKTELNRLNIDSLALHDQESCFYGQMTGDCYNKRANNLIKKCALPNLKIDNLGIGYSINYIRGSDNHTQLEISGSIYSKSIISYLKGETKILRLRKN